MTTKDVLALALEALETIIQYNRDHARDQYGDAEKAERWACVVKAREAITAIKQAQQAQDPLTDEQLEQEFCELVGLTTGINPEAVDTKRALVWFKRGYRHAAPKQAQPEGYKLVPVVATPEMINAGRICPMPTDSEWDEDEDYSAVYRAMLAAAPTPPEAKA